ncbi:MAG TPA: ABC transporter permease [Pseudobdellovibrionaceae bacterium]|nr:ABC transporter permease [Pseudobdellovibrionaceae bacterium]
MAATSTIFRKEARIFFTTPGYFMMSFLITLILSWNFPIRLSEFSQRLSAMGFQPGLSDNMFNIHYGVFLAHLSYLNLLLIFISPALTMKLFSEEKKLRSFDLLLTSPVSSLEIVLGKYLAALVAIGGIVLTAMIYPVTSSMFADLNWGPLFVSFAGIFAVAGVYLAINLFCSSLTENVLVAYVMSVVMNIAIWLVASGAEITDSEIGRKVFEHISLSSHLSALVEGTIRTSSIIFLLSVIGLFLFLCERVVESARWR